MGIFHFLNVKQGDCNIIQHPNGHVTVIDVSNARLDDSSTILGRAIMDALAKSVQGNFGQKDYPVNPIEYMRARGITSIFRFIATHPDMDHLDGIKDLFEAFPISNFWDTKNEKELEDWGNNSPYRQEDWKFYKSLRDGTSVIAGLTRLTNHSGDRNKYWNMDDQGGGGDGLHILAPTKELISSANDCGDHNDCSYAILYRSAGGRILFLGDAHDATVDHILANHAADVADVELLVAPHHGRHSNRKFDFLNVVRPKLTLFGNAPSEHLAYAPWYNRGLPIITNNQANCVVVDTDTPNVMNVYVTHEKYARAENAATFYSEAHGGWFVCQVSALARAA
jgi:beta-lactamase superfamily II metal-dependent hydrolase